MMGSKSGCDAVLQRSGRIDEQRTGSRSRYANGRADVECQKMGVVESRFRGEDRAHGRDGETGSKIGLGIGRTNPCAAPQLLHTHANRLSTFQEPLKPCPPQ